MEQKRTEDILEETAHLPAEEQVARLFEIIDAEINKPDGDVDYERVEACSRRIDELARGGLLALSDEHILQIRAKAAGSKRPRRSVRRPIRIIAAVVAILLLHLLVIPVGGEFSTVELLHYGAKILQKGESIRHGDVTVIRNGDFVSCTSLEELPAQYRWDVYYPITLPNGITVHTIYVNFDSSTAGTCELIFNFSDPTVFVNIQNYRQFDLSLHTEDPVYGSAAGNFVIITTREGYQAICQSETYEYYVRAQEEATVKAIIDGLGKLQ